MDYSIIFIGISDDKFNLSMHTVSERFYLKPSFTRSVMKIFIDDIFTGIALILSILVILAGILVSRYRGGKGPIFLAMAGAVSALSSIMQVLIIFDLLKISSFFPMIGWFATFIILIVSAFTWREKR